MNEVQSLGDQLSDSASEFWTAVGAYMPKLVSALILIILALVFAKLFQYIAEKALKLLRVDKLQKNKTVAKTLHTAEINVDIVSIVGRVVFWSVIAIFALTIADVLQLAAMRDVIREFVAYLPNVLAAAVVLTVAVAGARIIRDVVRASLARMRVDYANGVAMVTFYVLMIFGVVMALDQLGFETTILTNNITVIIAGIMLAFGLAFGLGGRDTAGKIVEDVHKHLKNKKQ
jgi:hypothetical protein